MARDDMWAGDDDYFDPGPDYKEILFGNESIVDHHAQELFMEAYFQENDRAYQELVDYMWEEYGIDWEDAFDWQDFREYYDSL